MQLYCCVPTQSTISYERVTAFRSCGGIWKITLRRIAGVRGEDIISARQRPAEEWHALVCYLTSSAWSHSSSSRNSQYACYNPVNRKLLPLTVNGLIAVLWMDTTIRFTYLMTYRYVPRACEVLHSHKEGVVELSGLSADGGAPWNTSADVTVNPATPHHQRIFRQRLEKLLQQAE